MGKKMSQENAATTEAQAPETVESLQAKLSTVTSALLAYANQRAWKEKGNPKKPTGYYYTGSRPFTPWMTATEALKEIGVLKDKKQ